MEALNYESFSNHVGEYSMTINAKRNEIISGGEDFLMKIFDLETKTSKSIKDVDDEIKAIKICGNKLLFGQGNSIQMLDNFDSSNYNPKDSILLTNFNSAVRRIEYNSKYNCIIACSEDDDLHLVKLSTLDLYKYKTNHEGSLRNIRVSDDENILMTSGCDGYITFYDFIEEGKISINKKLKIANKTNLESKQNLQADINSNNQIVIVPGNTYLKQLDLKLIDSEAFSLLNIPTIFQKSDISICKWLNEFHFLTCDIENTVKIWEFDTKSCIYSNDFNNEIRNIELLTFGNKVKILISFKNGDLNISQVFDLLSSNNHETSKTTNQISKKELDTLMKEAEEDTEAILKKFEIHYKKEENENKHNDDNDNLLNLSDIEDGEGELKNSAEIAQSKKILLFLTL